jgi:hypothetical protein
MYSPIPEKWKDESPECLVGGDGPYAAALAATFETVAISLNQLRSEPEQKAGGGFTRVLENLKRSFVVVPDSMSPVEALACHESLWSWVQKLTAGKDQHDLVFVFLLPATASASWKKALLVGLGVDGIAPTTIGHVIWQHSGCLRELLDLVVNTKPCDLVALRARRAADAKHLVIERLRVAMTNDDLSAGRNAAREVLSAFSGYEYQLDLFCRPPSHPNGNLLRRWLTTAVNDSVTLDWNIEKYQLNQLLA